MFYDYHIVVLRLLYDEVVKMAEQMIQKKQLRSTTSFEEEVDIEKSTDETCKGNEVTKKNSKVEVQGTKTKKLGSSVGSTVSATRSSGTKNL